MLEETFDPEEALAEADRTPASPERLWESCAQVALLVLRALPGGRIQCGGRRQRTGPVDYVTLMPNPPLNLYGPDGRFIVSFTAAGSWIDAQGVERRFAGTIEGSPEAIAWMLLRDAGLQQPYGRPRGERIPHSDGLPRLLAPSRTGTWRDHIGYSFLPDLPQDAPATIAWPDWLGRLLVARYDPQSCTFLSSHDSTRWGVESLRIPALHAGFASDGFLLGSHEVCPGDCLVTWGTKHDGPSGPSLGNDDATGDEPLWFPQRVVHVEPEGAGHLRVWLLRDDRVANHRALPSVVGLSPEACERICVLTGRQRRDVLAAFVDAEAGSRFGEQGTLIPDPTAGNQVASTSQEEH